MSPVLREKTIRRKIPGRVVLMILAGICVFLMVITYGTNSFDAPFNNTVGNMIVPFEKGLSKLGIWMNTRKDEFRSMEALAKENEELKAKVDELTEENTILSKERYELAELRDLFELSDEYDSYSKVGARIIASDNSNWFYGFTIDKGSEDGLQVDMNVIAGGGLVGRISSVGDHWARVTAIISDGAYVSGQVLSTEDTLIVAGNLEEIRNDGTLSFSQLSISDNVNILGEKVVTSQISDKYLPGLLIGYVQSADKDSNNLTYSGKILPVVDFEHLGTVLVITDMKNAASE
ncbi:MAG: rod shape-determining protein MreC [Lachnospiraceae bacterium]|nr:rod shape-determining protein MreC [Lachnospiraceae bacterium]